MRNVADVDTGWDVRGATVALPFGIAPTGFTRLMHTDGEIAGAHAAARAGIPFALSTLATSSIEDVKAANPHGRNWFQLYMWKDRDRSMALLDAIARPRWWFDLMTTEPLSFASLDRWPGTVAEYLDTMFDPEILSGQVSRTMRLLGVTRLEELSPRHVTQLHRFSRSAS